MALLTVDRLPEDMHIVRTKFIVCKEFRQLLSYEPQKTGGGENAKRSHQGTERE